MTSVQQPAVAWRRGAARAPHVPRPGEVHVWWGSIASSSPRLECLLDESERGRLVAYRRADDRARFLLGCAIAKLALGSYLDTAPTAVALLRDCPDCGEPHGKPRVSSAVGGGLELSISHAGGLVAVAIASGTPVGVDVEQLDSRPNLQTVSALVLSEAERRDQLELDIPDRERAILISWTRKEASAKAVGLGLRLSPRDIEVTPPQDPPRLLAWEHSLAPEQVTLCDLALDSRHVACLAVLGRCESIVELDAAELLDGRFH